EGYFPAVAIGLNDFAGTGFYSSEYIVSSYGVKNVDFHFGLGWGQLSGDYNFKNPFSYISDRFNNRPSEITGLGGSFNPDSYFSGPKASPFFGVSYRFKNKLFFNFEKDPVNVVDTMSNIISKTEEIYNYDKQLKFDYLDEFDVIQSTVTKLADDLNADGILALTSSGKSAIK
ncbi:MAG: YjbH domain-containing protein, partial [Flavobacteriales bacterium]